MSNTNNNGANTNTLSEERKKEYEDTKILVLDAKNTKLDMSDSLVKSDNFRRPLQAKESKMKLTLCDYENKDTTGSITAWFNFTPEEIGEFNFIMEQKGDFIKKLYRPFYAPDPEKDNMSPIKMISIGRQAKTKDGQIANYPVHISIENGIGKVWKDKKTKKIGFNADTFKSEKKCKINLSNMDARILFRESAQYIERIRMIWMQELMGSSNPASGSAIPADGVTQKDFVDAINRLHKSLKDNMDNHHSTLMEEVETIKNEVMFNK